MKRKPKRIKSIKGITSSLITFDYMWDNYITAKIDLERDDIGELIKALQEVQALNFTYTWCTYDLGYYDSVDDKRIELSRSADGLEIEYV